MNPNDPTQPNYIEIGSDSVNETGGFDISSTPASNSPVTSPTPKPENPNIVQLGADGVLSFGTLRSPNYATGSSGWRITSDGNVEFGDGYFRGDITGASGTFTGTVTATTGSIGGFNIGADYIRDVANTMGLASTVTGGDDIRFWSGDTFANRATAPFRVTEAGAVTASNFSFTGGTVGSAVVVALGALNIAARGWSQTSAFSVTDADTVAWGAGTFTSADGTAYSISAGNTGNMSAFSYIYLDTAVSTTAYQTSTSFTAGAGKVLIATAQNNTDADATEATYFILSGAGQNISAGSIAANSITANELSTSILYAGSIQIDTSGNIRSGQTAFNTGTGWFIGNNAGTPVLSIGDPAGTNLLWDGTNLSINGFVQRSIGSFGGDGSDGALTLSSTTITFDAASSVDDTTGGTTSSWSHTVGSGASRILVVGVSHYRNAGATSVAGITFGTQALTKKTSVANGTGVSELWYLLAPTTGSATITVTYTLAVGGATGGATSWSNVNQDIPMGTAATATGTSTAPSVTVTSATGELVVDHLKFTQVATATVGAGQTSRYNITGGGGSATAGAGSSEAGAATVAMSWTLSSSVAWATCGVSLKPTVGNTSVDLGGAKTFIKNYSSVSITGSAALTFTNPHASGTLIEIRCKGDFTVTSNATRAIDARGCGAAGGVATTSSTGNDGTSAWLQWTDPIVGKGNAGTATVSTGIGGTIYGNRLLYPLTDTDAVNSLFGAFRPRAGSGGGSGSGNGTEASGAGGNGGGALYIECAGAYNVTGTIDASGSVGGTGSNATAGNRRGPAGGGGGSAGSITIIYNSLTADSGTYTCAGGAGGSSGTRNGTGGSGTGRYGGGGAGGFGAAGANGGDADTAGSNGGSGSGGGGGGVDTAGGANAGGTAGASYGGYVSLNYYRA